MDENIVLIFPKWTVNTHTSVILLCLLIIHSDNVSFKFV